MALAAVSAALFATLAVRDGLHVQTYTPSRVANASRGVLWVNGGPATSVSYTTEDAVAKIAERLERPITWFDPCGTGRSTCAAASSWDELTNDVADVAKAVMAHGNISTVVLWSAAALTMDPMLLQGVRNVVYLTPPPVCPSRFSFVGSVWSVCWVDSLTFRPHSLRRLASPCGSECTSERWVSFRATSARHCDTLCRTCAVQAAPSRQSSFDRA